MSTNAADLKKLDDELNQMILTGQAMEAMHRFYAEDCKMQENHDAPCVGLAANVEREKQFFAQVEAFHGARILTQAIGDGVTYTEWETDVTMKGAPRRTSQQVAQRRWKNGKIVHERFFHE
jgi:hypothetical protein